MASKREFNGMGYRQVQRSNSENKAKMQSEETQLYLKIQAMLTSPYRENWSLDELFLEADRIGRKYQSADEIATFEKQFTMLSQEIDDEIDRHFPDTEVEIIDFSRV
jgi:hypothetical protein